MAENKILSINDNGAYYLKLKNQKLIFIKDGTGALTKHGFLLCMLNEMIQTHQVETVFTSSDIHDE